MQSILKIIVQADHNTLPLVWMGQIELRRKHDALVPLGLRFGFGPTVNQQRSSVIGFILLVVVLQVHWSPCREVFFHLLLHLFEQPLLCQQVLEVGRWFLHDSGDRRNVGVVIVIPEVFWLDLEPLCLRIRSFLLAADHEVGLSLALDFDALQRVIVFGPWLVLLLVAVEENGERKAGLNAFLNVRAKLLFIISKPHVVFWLALVVLLDATLEAAVVFRRLVQIGPIPAVLLRHDFVNDAFDDDVLRMLRMVMHAFH